MRRRGRGGDMPEEMGASRRGSGDANQNLARSAIST